MGFDSAIEQEFHAFARQLETDPLMVLLAKWRRATVIDALKNRPDVLEIIPSGSLARGTHLGRIHDVDLIVVFDERMHPDWNGDGSARMALEHVQAMVGETLQGGPFSLVHDTEPRNHVVKANLDPSWGPLDVLVPSAPPIDVMPAFRQGSHLRVPERLSDRWIDVDPEHLMRMVAVRQREWSNFDQVVRMIKDWADHHELGMNRLAVEVMVLTYLPRPGLFETMSCSDAVARFFEAASRADITELVDPAGRCGQIDPNLNYRKLREELKRSAKLARLAVAAERDWENRHSARDGVTHPSVYWQQIFGENRFRRPRIWFWSPQFPDASPPPESRRWFDERTEAADRTWRWTRPAPDAGSWDGPDRADGGSVPKGPRLGPDPADSAGGAVFAPDEPEPDSLENTLAPSGQEVPVTPSAFGIG